MDILSGSVSRVVGCLARLVCPLMVTCMGCLIAGVVCLANLARSAVLSKQLVMSGCVVVERSCSGVGPGGRISRVIANSPNQWLAKNVDRGFG